MSKKVIISVTNDIVHDQRMLKTAFSLLKSNFKVHIVGRNQLATSSMDEISTSYSFHRFSLWFHSGKLFYIEYQIRLFIYLLYHKADIYCAVDLDTILPNVIVSRLRRKPLIYDAHEYFTEVPELQGRWFEKKVWKMVEKYSIPFCQRIYTVSESIAKLLSQEYHRHVDVIFNYPLKNQEIQPELERENIILYQGDLNEGRGLELAIMAMGRLPDWKLWIFGDGYHRRELECYAQRFPWIDRIVFFGRKNPLELKEYTSKARFGLNLLENKGLNYYYSLANKFFDYIQARVIPISMNFPEYKNIQERYKCSLLIDSLDEDQLVDALQSAANDEKIYVELSKNVDIAASFLTWESQEEKLSSIYKNV